MKPCTYRYHSTFAGYSNLVCPSCKGHGKIKVVAEFGKPLNQQPSTLRSTFRAFVVALVEYVGFKLRGSK